MKFEIKDLDKHNLIICDDKKPCNICKESTEYIEYCYEVRCCSEECLKELDNKYEKWIKEVDKNESICSLDL